jgi:hypothetical protein
MNVLLIEEKSHVGGKYFYYKNLFTTLTSTRVNLYVLNKTDSTMIKVKKMFFFDFIKIWML